MKKTRLEDYDDLLRRLDGVPQYMTLNELLAVKREARNAIKELLGFLAGKEAEDAARSPTPREVQDHLNLAAANFGKRIDILEQRVDIRVDEAYRMENGLQVASNRIAALERTVAELKRAQPSRIKSKGAKK